jgi:FtsZ-binding cell division protein ZapB
MDSSVVELFNGIGAGTFILLCITLCTFLSVVLSKGISIAEKHRNKVKDETMEEVSMDNLKESVETLIASVDTLTNKVETLNTEFYDFKDKTSTTQTEMQNEIGKLNDQIKEIEGELLVISESNKSAIRSYIVSEYQKWMKLGFIDVYSLSLIEDRFNDYSNLHGNTFIYDLMQQIRRLKTKSYITDENGNDPIKYFADHPEKHPKYNSSNSESST